MPRCGGLVLATTGVRSLSRLRGSEASEARSRGWGGGASTGTLLLTDSSPTRRALSSASTSPASGRGKALLICPTGCFVIWLSSPVAKYFLLYRLVETSLEPASSHPSEGRIAIVTDAGWDAMDAGGAFDESAGGGRRSRVVLTPRRWRQVLRKCPRDDGGKKARSPGRARNKPLKPSCRKRRVNPAEPVATTLVCFLLCTRGCGCSGHPAFPAPSDIGGNRSCTTRAHRAAGMRRRVLQIEFLTVIAREGGRSSIPRHPRWNRKAAAYWIPRMRGGMTNSAL
jgi:hypothetical protein